MVEHIPPSGRSRLPPRPRQPFRILPGPARFVACRFGHQFRREKALIGSRRVSRYVMGRKSLGHLVHAEQSLAQGALYLGARGLFGKHQPAPTGRAAYYLWHNPPFFCGNQCILPVHLPGSQQPSPHKPSCERQLCHETICSFEAHFGVRRGIAALVFSFRSDKGKKENTKAAVPRRTPKRSRQSKTIQNSDRTDL